MDETSNHDRLRSPGVSNAKVLVSLVIWERSGWETYRNDDLDVHTRS